MQKSLDTLLRDAIAAIPYGMNREIALFYLPGCSDEVWRADAVNECPHVTLGEMDGKFSSYGATPEAAVAALIENILAYQIAP